MERLRGHQDIGEIRAAGLRFSPEESRLLLQQLLGPEAPRLTPSPKPWPCWRTARRAGRWGSSWRRCRCAARPTLPPLPARLPNMATKPLRNTCWPRCWGAFPLAQRAILLQSSLFDRFCAPRLDAAQVDTGRLYGAGRLDGESFVRAIRCANLFDVALDEAGTWFRYHHFFQALLRMRLAQDTTPDAIKAIHARASRWFEAQGLVGEAVVHACGRRRGGRGRLASRSRGLLRLDRGDPAPARPPPPACRLKECQIAPAS